MQKNIAQIRVHKRRSMNIYLSFLHNFEIWHHATLVIPRYTLTQNTADYSDRCLLTKDQKKYYRK